MTQAERLENQETRLVARIRASDEPAFAELFREYYPALCRYVCARIGSAAEAEDIVMDVFRKLWEGRARWVLSSSLRSYLFSAAHNGIRSALRHRRVEIALEHDIKSSVRALPGAALPPQLPSARAEQLDLSRVLSQEIERLPEAYKEVFVLWQQQLSYAEIGRTLGISLKSVEGRLARAVRTLRERLANLR